MGIKKLSMYVCTICFFHAVFTVRSKYTITCTFTEIQFRRKYKHIFSGEMCFL
uniref:Uncharacterized protein n=1 Tax=Anguilla anguilla TaxID=7936 RepID=A0A0E9XZF4_ANGAN